MDWCWKSYSFVDMKNHGYDHNFCLIGLLKKLGESLNNVSSLNSINYLINQMITQLFQHRIFPL